MSDVPVRATAGNGAAVAFLQAGRLHRRVRRGGGDDEGSAGLAGPSVRGLVPVCVLGDLAHIVEAVMVGEETVRARDDNDLWSVRVRPGRTAGQ